MINARQESLAAKINSAKIVSGRRSQAGEVIIGSGEVGMSLRRRSVTRVECAIGDDTGPEAGDSSAGTDSDAAGNLAGSGIGHGGSTQDSEIFGRSEGLCVKWDCGNRQGGEGDEKVRDEPAAVRDGSIIDSPDSSRVRACELAAATDVGS
jgi:hypothetical protein